MHRTLVFFSLVFCLSFNLCCPATVCGGLLDKIEGCNAITCSDESCKATFCYLCLNPQADSPAAHDHARGRSNNYWDFRPGFTERYHRQISRKEMGVIFKGKIDSKIKNSALKENLTFAEL